MTRPTVTPIPVRAAVQRLVPMAHVADVQRSLDFYQLLGFQQRSVVKGHGGVGVLQWAHATTGEVGASAEIMFARASGDVDPTVQAVLFYMYSEDVAGLRAHLLASGLHDGGEYCGQAGPNNGRRVVFEVSRPFYMPEGEVRIADPDGYCILVGQLG